MYAPPYSGKSTLAKTMIENASTVFEKPPHKVVYCYNEFTPMLKEMQKTITIPFIMHEGVPNKETRQEWNDGHHYITVIDDLQQTVERKKEFTEMFTVGSHHHNNTIIYLCHNIFARGQFSRTINVNAHYIILFRNNRDKLQVKRLGSQIFPTQSEQFMNAYEKATNGRYGYLLIDTHPYLENDQPRLWTNIVGKKEPIAYTLPTRNKY